MSYPQDTATNTSTPNSQRPFRHLLPSPHFERPHSRLTTYGGTIEGSAPLMELPGGFQPFFVLIENSLTSEHYHPSIYYIFADDDTEIITEAACQALAQDDAQHVTSEHEEDNKLPAVSDDVREHYILLDVQPCEGGSRYEVTKAHSLSARWQVTSALISNAPTIDGADPESGEGLMLKIQGIGAIAETGLDGAGKGKESLQQMVERFGRELAAVMRTVDDGQLGAEMVKHQSL